MVYPVGSAFALHGQQYSGRSIKPDGIRSWFGCPSVHCASILGALGVGGDLVGRRLFHGEKPR